MSLSLKTATPYILTAIIIVGVFGGIKLNELVNSAKTIAPAKKA